MPKTHTRHKRNSHQAGTAVEFIGKDKKSRGIGIVMAETNSEGMTVDWQPTQQWHFEQTPEWVKANFNSVKDDKITHCKVFWQISQEEEIIHKAFLRICPDTTKVAARIVTK